MIKNYIYISIFVLVILSLGLFVKKTRAGSLTPSVSPSSTMYTLDAIYNKILDNTSSSTEGTQSFSVPSPVASTFHTLKQIYEAIPTLDATKIASGTTYMGVAGTLSAGSSASPLKTGVTNCYDASGSIIICAGDGQDADALAGVSHSYTDNSNGTITDTATGLTWQKDDLGFTASWIDALNYCHSNTPGLPGSGWRLPNLHELFSLTDYGKASTAINATYFPTTIDSPYWSSTTYLAYAGNANRAWYINFDEGKVAYSVKNVSWFVRCVR